MTEQECKRLMLTLTAAYPNVNMPGQTHKVYIRLLSDLPLELAEAAILEAINRCKFLPTVSEIRDIAGSLARPDSLTAGEAWTEVLRAISKWHYYGKPEFSSELVKRSVEAIGWQTVCTTETIGVERAHFMRIYEQLVGREHERMRMLPEVRKLLERLTVEPAKLIEAVNG